MRQKLEELITKSYLDTRLEEFVTKAYLDMRLQEMSRDLYDHLDQTISKVMDKFYTRIDPILIEVENSRLERELRAEKDEGYPKRLRNHELRILEGN